jgi:dienelactone hydrolase
MSAASRDAPQSHPRGSTDNWSPCGAGADFAADRLGATACRFGGRAKLHDAVRRWRRRAAKSHSGRSRVASSAARNTASRSWLLAVIFAACIGGGQAAAGALVEFPNLPGREPVRLFGYLARPDASLSALTGGSSSNAAPYPAVVVLHGCGGISSHSAAIADRLGGWGYVALTVDTLGRRGMEHGCSSSTFQDQAFDAYAALRYLATLPIVDPARVALLGQSMGGAAALYAIDRDSAAQYFSERFRAAIAYYPGCAGAPASTMTAPVLILIGGAEEWKGAEFCERLKAGSRPNSAQINLVVYPGVHHAFDVTELQPGRNSVGRWLEYDEPAARDAEAKTRVFLADHLAGPPSPPQARPR